MTVAFSIGLFIVIATIADVYLLCSRIRRTMHQHSSSHRSFIDTTTINDDSITIRQGLDQATLLTYLRLLYSHAKLHEGDSIVSVCSICLVDYRDTDMLCLLPYCGHLFHQKCVDLWLRLHPT
ncbi:unnamed protein product, partial [Ilex paraguariensis]